MEASLDGKVLLDPKGRTNPRASKKRKQRNNFFTIREGQEDREPTINNQNRAETTRQPRRRNIHATGRAGMAKMHKQSTGVLAARVHKAAIGANKRSLSVDSVHPAVFELDDLQTGSIRDEPTGSTLRISEATHVRRQLRRTRSLDDESKFPSLSPVPTLFPRLSPVSTRLHPRLSTCLKTTKHEPSPPNVIRSQAALPMLSPVPFRRSAVSELSEMIQVAPWYE